MAQITTTTPPARARWFRFWLRTLFVLLALIGAWLSWELYLALERQAALKWLRTHKAAVELSDKQVPVWQRPLAWAMQNHGGGDVVHPLGFVDLSLVLEADLPQALKCAARLDCVGPLVLRHARLTDKAILELVKCHQIKELILTGTDIGNDTLKKIAALSQLEVLLLNQTAVSDAGLPHLRALVHLSQLDLSGTAVTDRGLESIGNMHSLEWLILQGTQITGAGAPSLAALPNLVDLDISGTAIDETGARILLRIPTLDTLGISSTAVSPPAVSKLEREYPKVFFY